MLRTSAVALVLLLFICSAVSATADTDYSSTDKALKIIGSDGLPLTDGERQQLYELGLSDEEIESLISLATLSNERGDTNPYVVAVLVALFAAVIVTAVLFIARVLRKANPSS